MNKTFGHIEGCKAEQIDGFQIHFDALLDSANANERLSEVLQRLFPDSNSLIRDDRCSTSEL